VERERPIGWWLKQLDRLIEERFERTLHDRGLRRRHWQVLDILAAGPTPAGRVAEALAPFAGAGEPVPGVVEDLVARGWVTPRPDGLQLTEAGRRGHAEVSEQVAETRRLVAYGISAGDYQQVVATLRRMVGNLEAAQSPGDEVT